MKTASNDSLLNNLKATTRAFRLGLEGYGSERLTDLIDSIGRRLTELPGESLQKLNPLLENVFNAIARRDYLWAADLFDYEIMPLLSDSADAETSQAHKGKIK